VSVRHCGGSDGRAERPDGEIVIAIAGNPNVGKSTLFNAMTGLGVSTAHYPGTTREVYTGTARFGERIIGVVDLPGIYGFCDSGADEEAARRALLDLAPDVVVIVVDPAILARNLCLAFEALERGFPIVVAVNLADEARRAGIEVDRDALASALGAEVVSTTATRSIGVEQLVQAAFRAAEGGASRRMPYDSEPEVFPDPLLRTSAALRSARERHAVAGRVASAVLTKREPVRGRLPRDFTSLTTWPWTGVPLVIVVAAAVFGFLFFVGDLLASAFSALWAAVASPVVTSAVAAVAGDGLASRVLLWGFDAGLEASLAIGLPYILTFYFLLGFLEDTGYLNSLAFLSDRVMHRLGLHGRAMIPLVAAAGCNVPALVAAAQLPTKRERTIASTLVLFVPCSARTAVILGSVGHYIGLAPALLVLAVVFAVWLSIALSLERMLRGRSRGLIMEMFAFRRPSLRRVAAKAWGQFREFLFVATPIVVAGSLVLGGLYESGWLMHLSRPLSPLVEGWLGLPAVAGVTLVVGMLRKELSLQLLVALAVATAGSAGAVLADIMTPTDLVVFAVVNSIALPCISSVAMYWRQQGWGRTLLAVGASIAIAIILGGLIARILAGVGFGG